MTAQGRTRAAKLGRAIRRALDRHLPQIDDEDWQELNLTLLPTGMPTWTEVENLADALASLKDRTAAPAIST